MTEPLDISSEQGRTYHYDEGRVVTIEDPQAFHITDTGSHRVITKGGRTYRPTPGWLAISWMPHEGAPAFIA